MSSRLRTLRVVVKTWSTVNCVGILPTLAETVAIGCTPLCGIRRASSPHRARALARIEITPGSTATQGSRLLGCNRKLSLGSRAWRPAAPFGSGNHAVVVARSLESGTELGYTRLFSWAALGR